MLLQASLLSTAFEIARTHNERGLSPVPFLTLFANSAVWTIYASTKDNMLPVLVPNFFGVLTGLMCLILYHFFSPTELSDMQLVCMISITLFSIILGNTYH